MALGQGIPRAFVARQIPGLLMDPNGDFKRAMGVNNVPHTFLVDKEGNIVYSHNNYAPGDELKLYEELKKLGK